MLNMISKIASFSRLFLRKMLLARLKKRGLVIGNRVNLQQGVVLDPSHCWHIQIGDDVIMAPNVHILAHDASTKNHIGLTKIGNVIVGNSVFIGANSVVLPGVTIGENTVIGACSLVSKDIPANVVATGNPIRVVSHLSEFVVQHLENHRTLPVFDATYTIGSGPTPEKKREMVGKLQGGKVGYVV